MNISSVTTTTALPQATRQPPKPPTFDNAAKLLGMSTGDLQSALKSGETLDDLAQDKGVASSDLTNAVKADLQASKPAGAPDLSDDQLTQMATNVAAGKGPGGPHGAHHGHRHASAGDSDDATTADTNLADLASSLGVSQTDLLSKLTQGIDFSTVLGQSSSPANPYSASGATTATANGGVAVDTYA
jgi:hypothetical protein